MDEEGRARTGVRRDRVYVATQYEAAALFAALFPDGGWVYRVLPEGPLEPDPDCTDPELSLACPRALVVEAIPLDPATAVAQMGLAVEAARRVVAVVDTPTTVADQDAHLERLRAVLTELRDVLSGIPAGPPTPVQAWAELLEAAAPFLQLAQDRLARRSWEPIPDEDCRRFLRAFGHEEVRHG
jgi:hypothetical protein